MGVAGGGGGGKRGQQSPFKHRKIKHKLQFSRKVIGNI